MDSVKTTIIKQQLQQDWINYRKRIALAGEHPHQWVDTLVAKYAAYGLPYPRHLQPEIRCTICGIDHDHADNQQDLIAQYEAILKGELS